MTSPTGCNNDTAQLCNNGKNILGVTNDCLIGLKAYSISGNSCLNLSNIIEEFIALKRGIYYFYFAINIVSPAF